MNNINTIICNYCGVEFSHKQHRNHIDTGCSLATSYAIRLENELGILRAEAERLKKIVTMYQAINSKPMTEVEAEKIISQQREEISRLKAELLHERTKRGPYPLFDQDKIGALHDENERLKSLLAEARGGLEWLAVGQEPEDCKKIAKATLAKLREEI